MNKSYPLMRNNILREDLDKIIDYLKQDDPILTQSKNVAKFEQLWSEWLGVKYSIFVNSGSSANLLSIAILKIRYPEGGEIIVPPLTWSSDISSIILNGFTPKFVDIDFHTLAMNGKKIINAITEKTVAVFLTHAQGFNGLTDDLIEYLNKKNIPLIEDVCESHGAMHKEKKLGSYGLISNFSFYYAHHMTTIEGGMIVTNDDYIANKIKSLRSHGWTRDMDDAEMYERQFPEIDPRFLFVNVGYNLRSTDMNAAIGLVQLKKLKKYNESRHQIGLIWNKAFLHLKKKGLFFPMEVTKNTKASWFGFPVICKDQATRDKLREHLEKNGIETRPIICGNMTKQPGIKNILYRVSGKLKGADEIMNKGIFWGSSPGMTKPEINHVIKTVNRFFE